MAKQKQTARMWVIVRPNGTIMAHTVARTQDECKALFTPCSGAGASMWRSMQWASSVRRGFRFERCRIVLEGGR